MEWSYEVSILVYLILVAFSFWLTAYTNNKIFIQLPFGLLIIAGFTFGFFDRNFIATSTFPVIGFIACNLFVVNSGTNINFREIKKEKESLLPLLFGLVSLILVNTLFLKNIIGRELAIASTPALIGNGAANALGAVMMRGINPDFAPYPWLVFIFQGVLIVPIFIFALKKIIEKESKDINDLDLQRFSNTLSVEGEKIEVEERLTFAEKLPKKYKTTAYTFCFLMMIFMLNTMLHKTLFKNLALPINTTALILGIVVRQLGLIDSNPLQESDSFGLLLLGLVSLMGNIMANSTTEALKSLILPTFITILGSAIALVLGGIVYSKVKKIDIWRGIVLVSSVMLPIPSSILIFKDVIDKSDIGDELKGKLFGELFSKIKFISVLATGPISIVLAEVMLMFV